MGAEQVKAFVPAGGNARRAAMMAGRLLGERADFTGVTRADRYVICETRRGKDGRELGRVWFAPYASRIDKLPKVIAA